MIHAGSYTGTTGLLKPSGPLIDENVIRKLIFDSSSFGENIHIALLVRYTQT